MSANGEAAANGSASKKQKTGSGDAPSSLHAEHSVVLVLDYGSQYTQLICRRIREIGVFSMMLPGDADMVRGGAERMDGSGWRAGARMRRQ